MAEVKLFRTWSSPFALRIVWAMKLKGVPYETIYEDLSNKSLCFFILEYMDEIWKENPLLPEDPLERAAARFWAKFGDDKVT
ncbi:unnamed protein product [Prunus armeniaca]